LIDLIETPGAQRRQLPNSSFQLPGDDCLPREMSAAYFTGDWVLRYAQCSNAFGDQKFKRHFVPFNCFAVFKK
jgi:hypothetical protein